MAPGARAAEGNPALRLDPELTRADPSEPTAVQPLRTEPFPVAAARDLLGLVRALYLVWRAQDAGGSDRLRALESVGLDLRIALDNARVMRAPNTPQQAAAWMLAERAIATLGELVGEEQGLRPLVDVLARKVRGTVGE